MGNSSRRRQAHAGVSQRRVVGDRRYRQLVRLVPRAPRLSQRAQARLAMLDWHFRSGRCVALTADHFGFSRPTVYRWLARYEALRLDTLEDRSSAPRHRRRSSWTAAHAEAVRELRERYPCWGKAKLAVLLRRAGIYLSVSMVGRIMHRLRMRGALREPARRRVSVRHRGYARPHAVRKPAGFRPTSPGDLVQLDTLDVRPPGVTSPFKQFTARDVVSRWDVLTLAANARAVNAVAMLDALEQRMPFPVRALSVDNGSEFMAEFEPRVRPARHRPAHSAAALAQAKRMR